MEKRKVFMPSMDDLYKMQDMGANIKLYLYAKAIESLCINYVNYPRKGSILKNEYKYLCEDEIIARAICKMYPNEMKYSEEAKYDVNLAKRLITNPENRDIYRLDYLSRFSDSVNDNTFIISEVISILAEELNNSPKYRFEYQRSKLLDDIFMGKITNVNNGIFSDLVSIEPYYALNVDNAYNVEEMLKNAVINYINRYSCDYIYFPYEKGNEDILTNQTTEVKRLFRCINRK